MSSRIILATTAAALTVCGASTAHAGCHLIDCVENVVITEKQVASKSCEDLWILRNSIYKDAGYCFKSPKAIKWFGNSGCSYDDEAAVPLNDYQRANAKLLRAVSEKKGC